LGSTPRQIVLYHAFGYAVPRFLHVPLALDADGARLAKRQGAAGLAPLRAAGITPARVVGALAASVGLAEPGSAPTASELCARFDPARLIREPSVIAL
jgi:glutamyl-tRNA synthetase